MNGLLLRTRPTSTLGNSHVIQQKRAVSLLFFFLFFSVISRDRGPGTWWVSNCRDQRRSRQSVVAGFIYHILSF